MDITTKVDYLDVAVRAYTKTVADDKARKKITPPPRTISEDGSIPEDIEDGSDEIDHKRGAGFTPNLKLPNLLFIFDTETRTDLTQRLTFGCYRIADRTRSVEGGTLEEGLFHANDLSDEEMQTLRKHAKSKNLPLLTRDEFARKLYKYVYDGRGVLVGFNLPFDISRVAIYSGEARGKYKSGFSFGLVGMRKAPDVPNDYDYPRIRIKHVDSKKAFIKFSGCHKPKEENLIPYGSKSGKRKPKYCYPGFFIDCRTLSFALADKSLTLESACKAFGVKRGKQKVSQHGVITPEYIEYNRGDVEATHGLVLKLIEELDKYPINLLPTKAFSPASIGKERLQGMGVNPILDRIKDFPDKFLGYSQSAFYGGRTSAHTRNTPVPVVYTDFTSMYPTVNSLMGLWDFVTAKNIEVEENCVSEIEAFLNEIRDSRSSVVFEKETWKRLHAFVKILPHGDVVPVRAAHKSGEKVRQIGVNHLYAHPDRPESVWYALPDIVASVVLTGKVPKIVEAFRLKAIGKLDGLKPITLRGTISIDPAKEDFFRRVIELRNKYKSKLKYLVKGTPEYAECDTLQSFLKTLANSSSYGVYSELNQQILEALKTKIRCFSVDQKPFSCKVTHPEEPGKYYFPPVAALITSAARLMLALLEHCVTSRGGTYAMEDTDSMAIVSSRDGGLVPCEGGNHRMESGARAIKALSWKEVDEIIACFDQLNPYDPQYVKDLLKKEDCNFVDSNPDNDQWEIYCLAISAKRYAIFNYDADGNPKIVTNKAHGLGHLLNPIAKKENEEGEPKSKELDWIGQLWLKLIRQTLGLDAPEPGYMRNIAVSQFAITSTSVSRAFKDFNKGKRYSHQIKPFNFVLSCQSSSIHRPRTASKSRFHLITPYEKNSDKWLTVKWTDQYSRKEYDVRPSHEWKHIASDPAVYIHTYEDLLSEYNTHPESKCADALGVECSRETVGLLYRRHVGLGLLKFQGKESNNLDAVLDGVENESDVVNDYEDESRNAWKIKWLPMLQILLKERGRTSTIAFHLEMSRQGFLDIKSGRRVPHAKTMSQIVELIETPYLLKLATEKRGREMKHRPESGRRN